MFTLGVDVINDSNDLTSFVVSALKGEPTRRFSDIPVV
jgi:hypothetical protein